MLAKRIIPCLDVKDGRVVKGGNFVNLRDAGDPVEIASAYENAGADELTFLDITASHEKRNIILDVVARTAEKVFMPLTVGGGVRTLDDIRNLLKAGADKVAINTAAVKDARQNVLVARASLSPSTPNLCKLPGPNPYIRNGLPSTRNCYWRNPIQFPPGRSTRMEEETRPEYMLKDGRKKWKLMVPEKFYSPAWTAMEPKPDTT